MQHIDISNFLIQSITEIDAARTALLASWYLHKPLSLQRFGSTIALREPAHPIGLYNRVVGFSIKDADHLDSIIAHYEEEKLNCQIDLTPDVATPELLSLLHQRGFCYRGGLPVFRGKPERCAATKISVKHANDEATIQAALDLDALFSRKPPSEEERHFKARYLLEHPEFQLFIAFIEEQPAALASLYILGAEAHFANAHTLPVHRGKGCQQALLQHRIDVAARAGCQLAVTEAFFGTASHRNIERAGFRMAYITSWWVRSPTRA
jgi:GNAT superfamily N-acetyltransferase